MTDEALSIAAPLPSPEEVVEALRLAGWLLEQETASVLKRYGFHTVIHGRFKIVDHVVV